MFKKRNWLNKLWNIHRTTTLTLCCKRILKMQIHTSEIPLHIHQGGYNEKERKKESAGKNADTEPSYTAGGNEDGAATVENSLAVP